MSCTTTSAAAAAAAVTTATTAAMPTTYAHQIGAYVENLSTKRSTPGGGSAAAVGATVGSAAASIVTLYTTQNRDVESRAAVLVKFLMMYINPH